MDVRGGGIDLKIKNNRCDFIPSLQRWNATGAFNSQQYCSGDLECEMQFCEWFPL